MHLRTVSDPLRTPPPGAVTVGVARHLTPEYGAPEMLVFHRDRAALIHDLVRSTSIDVIDWGRTDQEDPPNEIVEVVVPIASALIGAGAVIIAGWVGRPRTQEADTRTVLGVALRTVDGTQIHFDYKTSTELEKVTQAIRELLDRQSTDAPT